MTINSNDELKITRQRPYSVHHQYLRIASDALNKAEKNGTDATDQLLISIAFASVTLEAFGNLLGDRLIGNWADFQSSSVIAKLRLICEHLHVPYDKQKAPWSHIVWLAGFRNKIVHAKPQSVTSVEIVTRAQYEGDARDQMPWGHPPSLFEKEVNLVRARASLQAVQHVITLLSEKLPGLQAFGISADASIGSVELHRNGDRNI